MEKPSLLAALPPRQDYQKTVESYPLLEKNSCSFPQIFQNSGGPYNSPQKTFGFAICSKPATGLYWGNKF